MLLSIQVYMQTTPLRTRNEIDEWMDVVIHMRDGTGLTRIVGVEGQPYTDVAVLQRDVDACLEVMATIFADSDPRGKVPAGITSIMELRGVFANEAKDVLLYLESRRDAFVQEIFRLNFWEGVQDVYEILIDSLRTVCENIDGDGIMIFD
jgi:hypothetical protein